MPPLIDHLRGYGDRAAAVTDSGQISYAQLADRVEQALCALPGPGRRLVMIETRNDLQTVESYLAVLAGGHVALPVPAGRDHDSLLGTYQPDVVIDGDGVSLRSGPSGPRHDLHSDLALLMSTSGSTGSPKLVRLSHTNLVANARSIADYLDIRPTDRAATTLPLSYCYGLSVLHSHLLVGGSVLLTDRSVADDEFWQTFRRHRATSFAGVPYTFELLERIGFAGMSLPHLRYVTQAGGKMPAERVGNFARLGERAGWKLYVMYGATEATARMAYLPPHLAAARPSAIGVAIPGGSFRLDPVEESPESSSGELVYRGPNVMMGYARSPIDLALPATVTELRTGDIARLADDGLYEIIGRRNRFVKTYGLRVDLDRLEDTLADSGVQALCTDRADRLAVVALAPPDAEQVRRIAAAGAGLPVDAVDAVVVDALPALPSGKPDYPAARTLAASAHAKATGHRRPSDLRELVADVLHLDPATVDDDASFVDLGGNSLNYVTMSIRLEQILGHLPGDWPRMSLRELSSERFETPSPRTRARGGTVETSIALRAAAIVAIVGSHAGLIELWGGAHILLGVAGYNFGRFCLSPLPRGQRIAHLRTTIAWIAVPSILWVAFMLLVTDDYHPTNLLLGNKFLGPHDSMTAGRLWFVEVLVWTLVALALLLWLPVIDRTERRHPFGLAMALLAVGLALRYDILGLDLGRDAWFTMLAFWFFALGWAASKAATTVQRIAVNAVLIVGLAGYFGSTLREVLVLTALSLLIWIPALRCPAALAATAGVVAEASLYTYLTHYQVYPLFASHELTGVVASIVVGITVTATVSLLRQWLSQRRVQPAGTGSRSAMSPS